ncbi:helix-turn-helix domain-containing protein [Tessaracoccus defluvii]|uniref:Helix-turn-helix domain-containing protein n=1 Tax=Tessaracoccus defluvii TaxID=1285901 RepID=A0A7H0H8U7_9ACTN|nr:helix-turn-helix domain-containing protein [Tessaracoccus defluvii]QNP56963.1 helix-turn-helix domain-containing protein [Tessaracoccus defluvii]
MSDLIRTSRKRTGLTGAQLADRLGISVGAVSRMERSERAGTIQVDTLRRALAAMGHDVRLDAAPHDPYAAFTPANVTDAINLALDEDRPEYALRLLTQAAATIAAHPARFDDDSLARRPSQIGDNRWEQLFRATMSDAIPSARRPAWAEPTRLSRAWYPFGHYPSLRNRAKAATPERLRILNIMIDQRSLSRA